MSISSLYLDAFVAVAKSAGFTAAAKQLNITQSALSQRIKNLEDDMGLTLFIRSTSGAVLTEAGTRLLRYCQTRDSLEEELVQDLNGTKAFEIAGTLRIAGYSSVLRSVLIPALRPLLQEHTNIMCEFVSAAVDELPGMLQRGEVDFAVMDSRFERANIKTEVIGQEHYVVIASAKRSLRDDVFLDNSPEDRATESFFAFQGKKIPKYRRAYFDDCYGIIDGVVMGLGRAVMPRHLRSNNSRIKVVEGYKPYAVDVVLHYYQQPFYSKLHQAVIKQLASDAARYL